MCCLFGLIDYSHSFTGKQKAKIIHALATSAEVRGTDASGIAYNSGGKLHVYKRPVPGHQLPLRIPNDAAVIMGHTRLTTQGNGKRNYNNHPFLGSAGITRLRWPTTVCSTTTAYCAAPSSSPEQKSRRTAMLLSN